METVITKSIIAGIFTFLILVSGFVLRKSGKPYKTGMLTIHKITVLLVIVLVILIYIQHLKLIQFSGIGLFLYIFSGMFLLISFITGALLSFDQFYFIRIFHKVSSWLTILTIPAIWLVCH